MAKFYGVVGYATLSETSPGVWTEVIVPRTYYGDLIRNTRRLVNTNDRLNDNISMSNEVSIVADPYANENFDAMRYVEFNGTKWEISNVEVQYPRLVLSVGGVYNC